MELTVDGDVDELAVDAEDDGDLGLVLANGNSVDVGEVTTNVGEEVDEVVDIGRDDVETAERSIDDV